MEAGKKKREKEIDSKEKEREKITRNEKERKKIARKKKRKRKKIATWKMKYEMKKILVNNEKEGKKKQNQFTRVSCGNTRYSY